MWNASLSVSGMFTSLVIHSTAQNMEPCCGVVLQHSVLWL